MDRLRALAREPALLIDFGETLIVCFIAWGIGGLTGDDQQYLVAALIALAGVAKAMTTKPFPVTVLTDATRAVLVALTAVFGVGLTADQTTILVTLVGTAFTLISRAQITPRRDPVQSHDGAGAGPVADLTKQEQGRSTVGTLGLALVILGFILLLLTLAAVIFVPIWVSILLVVIGLVIWLAGPSA